MGMPMSECSDDAPEAPGLSNDLFAVRPSSMQSSALQSSLMQSSALQSSALQSSAMQFSDEDSLGSIYLDPSLRSMVAFDIETEGLNPLKQRITAAAVYNGSGLCKVFVFKNEDAEEDARLRDEFIQILESAPRLCAFNGIRFDIPYIIKHWKLDPGLAERWVRKTMDIFEACKLGLRQTFKLSQLLAVNSMESKTGSGAEAVELARQKRWDELGAYCLQDTRLTYLATAQMGVILPLHTSAGQRLVMDRRHPSMFNRW